MSLPPRRRRSPRADSRAGCRTISDASTAVSLPQRRRRADSGAAAVSCVEKTRACLRSGAERRSVCLQHYNNEASQPARPAWQASAEMQPNLASRTIRGAGVCWLRRLRPASCKLGGLDRRAEAALSRRGILSTAGLARGASAAGLRLPSVRPESKSACSHPREHPERRTERGDMVSSGCVRQWQAAS